ncbi:hypothetical protein BW14_06900 [Bifidobacterium sp. UTBIF-68]|nr:hypothetical protein BW14_06900 [Bifidobacterium sp. UTBIF-68]
MSTETKRNTEILTVGRWTLNLMDGEKYWASCRGSACAIALVRVVPINGQLHVRVIPRTIDYIDGPMIDNWAREVAELTAFVHAAEGYLSAQ